MSWRPSTSNRGEPSSRLPPSPNNEHPLRARRKKGGPVTVASDMHALLVEEGWPINRRRVEPQVRSCVQDEGLEPVRDLCDAECGSDQWGCRCGCKAGLARVAGVTAHCDRRFSGSPRYIARQQIQGLQRFGVGALDLSASCRQEFVKHGPARSNTGRHAGAQSPRQVSAYRRRSHCAAMAWPSGWRLSSAL